MLENLIIIDIIGKYASTSLLYLGGFMYEELRRIQETIENYKPWIK